MWVTPLPDRALNLTWSTKAEAEVGHYRIIYITSEYRGLYDYITSPVGHVPFMNLPLYEEIEFSFWTAGTNLVQLTVPEVVRGRTFNFLSALNSCQQMSYHRKTHNV